MPKMHGEHVKDYQARKAAELDRAEITCQYLDQLRSGQIQQKPFPPVCTYRYKPYPHIGHAELFRDYDWRPHG